MLSLATDLDLENRLAAVARRLGLRPEDCALAALKSWVADHEEALASARQLGGGDGVHRPPEEFYD